jgi:hypothetical protein
LLSDCEARLRGLPWRGVHFFSTAHLNNRLSDTIECSQPLPKNFNSKFSTLSIQKHYPTPEWYAGCSRSLRAVIRVYDEAGNAIETPESHRRLPFEIFRELRFALSVKRD